MIAVTLLGTVTDIAYILPICSHLYKLKNKKIIFVFPDNIEKVDSIVSLLKLQKFTQDVVLIKYHGNNYNFNPNDYLGTPVDEYYNFFTPIKHFEYPTNFYESQHDDFKIDYHFALNLDLDFKYDFKKISATFGLSDIFPNYEIIRDDMDMLSILRELAYSKERHINFDNISVYFSLCKLPFYLYLFKKEGGYYINETKENFWLKLKNAQVLDIRSFGQDRKIESIYNKIYFNQ